METKRKRGLLIAAVIFQAVALIIAIFITVNPPYMNPTYCAPLIIVGPVIPVEILSDIVLSLIIYLMGTFLLPRIKSNSRKVMAGIFVGGVCAAKILVPFISDFILACLYNSYPVDEMTAYVYLENAINNIAYPLTVIALALFSMGCGRLMIMGNTTDGD